MAGSRRRKRLEGAGSHRQWICEAPRLEVRGGAHGRIVRRHVHVWKPPLVGLGKEGTKLAARPKLRKTAAADPCVFVGWGSIAPSSLGRSDLCDGPPYPLTERRFEDWGGRWSWGSGGTAPQGPAAIRESRAFKRPKVVSVFGLRNITPHSMEG